MEKRSSIYSKPLQSSNNGINSFNTCIYTHVSAYMYLVSLSQLVCSSSPEVEKNTSSLHAYEDTVQVQAHVCLLSVRAIVDFGTYDLAWKCLERQTQIGPPSLVSVLL